MSRTTTNTTVIDAMDRFEVCLETPLVPGELEKWAGALRAAYRELSPLLCEYLQTVHRPLLKQIAAEDPELLTHTEEMKHADDATRATLDRLKQWIEQLPEIASTIEPDEKRLEEHVSSLIRDGLEFVMHVRKQETVLNTWHQEAMFRDRGNVDRFQGLKTNIEKEPIMFHELVHNILNQQINAELQAWYEYLGMASWCSRQQLHGCEHWLRLQSQEEYTHAMKLYQFLVDRNLKINLLELKPPQVDFENIVQVFEAALKQEDENTRRIHKIFDIALEQKAFASVVELQWFIAEQVEEMRIARDNFVKARMISDDPGAILEFDRSLNERQPVKKIPE